MHHLTFAVKRNSKDRTFYNNLNINFIRNKNHAKKSENIYQEKFVEKEVVFNCKTTTTTTTKALLKQ